MGKREFNPRPAITCAAPAIRPGSSARDDVRRGSRSGRSSCQNSTVSGSCVHKRAQRACSLFAWKGAAKAASIQTRVVVIRVVQQARIRPARRERT